MPSFQGFSHVAFTVTDPERSASWWQDLFGAQRIIDTKVDDRRMVVLLVEGMIVGFMNHGPKTAPGDSFSEFRVGLDHFSLGCAGRADLVDWAARLDELGITNSGVIDAPDGHHLNFRDPDNIALEFFSLPS